MQGKGGGYVRSIPSRLMTFGVVIGLLVSYLSFGAPLRAAAAGGQFFAETGYTLSGPIAEAWQAGGGLWVYGYPISDPFTWSASNGEVVIAQYFERARLEYHPALAGTAYRVLGGLLGNDLAADRREELAFLAVSEPADGECDYFPATGHTLCGVFQRWWNDEGGLPVFGYPISEPFEEGGYLVQYFERARLEYHPENAGTRWEVELGLLGLSDASRRGLLDTPAFASANATTVTTRVDTTLYSAPGGGDTLGSAPGGTTLDLLGGPSYDWYYVGNGAVAGWVRFADLSWSTAGDPRNAPTYTLSSLGGDVAERVASVNDVASVAVYDPLTNRMYDGGGAGPVAAASLSKVLLLTAALQITERRLGDVDRGALATMIEYSDNDAANDVWNAIGGDAGAAAFLMDNNLDGFEIPNPYDWGAISAEAPAWATLLGLLGSGQLLSAPDTAFALGLLHDVIGEQRWGVLTPAADRLSIGKNGWYVDEGDAFDWRVNSAGFVDSADGALGVAPLVVVVLSRYPGERGMDWGVANAAAITDAVVARAERRWWSAEVERLRGQTPVSASLRDSPRLWTRLAAERPSLTAVAAAPR